MHHEFELFYNLCYKLTTPSCLLDPGILRLSSVTSVLKNIEFESQIFVNPLKLTEFPLAHGSFQDAFSNDKVLVSNPNFGHAAALFDERYGEYIFKDSTRGIS